MADMKKFYDDLIIINLYLVLLKLKNCKLTRNIRLEDNTCSSKCVRQYHIQDPFPCHICGNILPRYAGCIVQDQPSPHLQKKNLKKLEFVKKIVQKSSKISSKNSSKNCSRSTFSTSAEKRK